MSEIWEAKWGGHGRTKKIGDRVIVHKESMEEKLERLGACGKWDPVLGLPCVRSKDHPRLHGMSDCFAMVDELDGTVRGCWFYGTEKNWVSDTSQFPTDLAVGHPLFKKKMQEVVPDRRAAIAHTKAMEINT